MKRWFPIVLHAAGLVGLGSLALWRVAGMAASLRLAAGIALVAYLAHSLWESRISKRETSKPETDHDRHTLEICAAVKITLLAAVLLGPVPPLSPAVASAVAYAGILLIVPGALLRAAAIRALGEHYTHRIREPQLPLVVHGPYAWLRHPAYAGALLIQTGVVCIVPNWYAASALVVWYAAVIWRARVENQWLMQSESYRRYRKDVPGGLFPFGDAAKLQSSMPMLFAVAFVALIAVFAWRKLAARPNSMGLALGAVVTGYVAWLIVESRVSVVEIGRGKTFMDRGTMELYAFGRAVTVLTALGLPTYWHDLSYWYLAGAGLFVAGVVLRLSAIHSLGALYSYRVRVEERHKIVKHGPYRLVRHPAYAGMLLAHVGFVICFFHPVSAAVLLLWFIPAVLLRIRVEERALASVPGYADYAHLRKRLIPMVW
jgi:protein-S-isoprenylcysteine O-methyltransferase Ste14